MPIKRYLTFLWVPIIFIVAFWLIPLRQCGFMSMMPGDIGDSRLNNYFLENIYQFLIGHGASLWHLGFFSPCPYVLGFSDNLFGASVVYCLARVITNQADTAFQIWFLFGYVVNFFAAYFALRRLASTPIASAIGALIFSFAFPVAAHMDHAQLHYRFGIPLAAAMFILFLDNKDWRYFLAAAGWLVWQFYCTIYMGFFLLLLLISFMVMYFIAEGFSKRQTPLHIAIEFTRQWHKQPARIKILFSITVLFFICLLIVLFYPYLRASQLYGATRSISEIATMLPMPQSYFLSDRSWLWSSLSQHIADIPMRHEHQMFIGAVPLLLALMGCFLGSRAKNGTTFPLLAGSLAGLIILTLHVHGFSLWYLLARLPLASAIRAMTRIDQVFLFPIAYLAAVAIDALRDRSLWNARLAVVIVLPLMLFEFNTMTPPVSAKSEWRNRLLLKETAFPKNYAPDSIVFFAQQQGPFFADEFDAMWVALNHGVRTLNGHSGFYPPGFSPEFGKDCSELPKRVELCTAFMGKQNDIEAYHDLMRRVIPVGFNGCDNKWLITPPITVADREYTPDEIRKLSLQYINKEKHGDKWLVNLRIVNVGDRSVAGVSATGKPVRLSWRSFDSSGKPVNEWTTSKDLPSDIEPHNALDIKLYVDSGMEIKGGALQISLIQEKVFWAHEVGFVPLSIPWDK